MAIPATEKTIADTHNRIKSALTAIKARLPNYISRYSGPVLASDITDDVIPYFRGMSATVPPSSLFPAAWINALETYANSQTLTPPNDWVAEYDAAGAAIRGVVSAAAAALPTVDGKLSVRSIASDGTDTTITLTAAQVSAVKTALETLDAAIA